MEIQNSTICKITMRMTIDAGLGLDDFTEELEPGETKDIFSPIRIDIVGTDKK